MWAHGSRMLILVAGALELRVEATTSPPCSLRMCVAQLPGLGGPFSQASCAYSGRIAELIQVTPQSEFCIV